MRSGSSGYDGRVLFESRIVDLRSDDLPVSIQLQIAYRVPWIGGKS